MYLIKSQKGSSKRNPPTSSFWHTKEWSLVTFLDTTHYIALVSVTLLLCCDCAIKNVISKTSRMWFILNVYIRCARYSQLASLQIIFPHGTVANSKLSMFWLISQKSELLWHPDWNITMPGCVEMDTQLALFFVLIKYYTKLIPVYP